MISIKKQSEFLKMTNGGLFTFENINNYVRCFFNKILDWKKIAK